MKKYTNLIVNFITHTKSIVNTLIILLLFIVNAKAQTDTIFLTNQKIACNVKEVTPDEIKYVYPNEDVPISVYKNAVNKIIFKSGRIMTFTEGTSFRKLLSAEEYEKVSFTEVQGEVKGLYKLNEVSSKAKGTTTISNMDRVKDRAYRKLKIEAALAGANIIYLTQNLTNGNQFGSKYQSGKTTETMVSGVAYTNEIPDYNEFIKRIGSKKQFVSFEVIDFPNMATELMIEPFVKNVKIIEIENENGLIYIKADVPDYEPESMFRLVYMNDEFFTLYNKDKKSISNIRIKFKQ